MGNRDGAGLSVSEWLFRWLDEMVKPEHKIGTHERYEGIIRRQIIPYLGAVELPAVTSEAVAAMQSDLLRSGLSPSTVRNAHAILSAAYREAIRLGLTDRNPVASVALPGKRPRRVTSPTVAVVRELLRQAREKGGQLYPFLHLLVYTGMRRGEALALRWRNVNLDEGYLTVVESAVKTRSRGVVVAEPKTYHSHRTIDLDDGTIDELRRHHAAQIDVGLAVVVPEALVFPGRGGRPMAPSHLYRELKRLGERAGDPSITFHSLRHFHATISLQQRQNVVVVSKRLGHASVSMTLDIYGHTIPGWQKSAAEAFAAALQHEG